MNRKEKVKKDSGMVEWRVEWPLTLFKTHILTHPKSSAKLPCHVRFCHPCNCRCGVSSLDLTEAQRNDGCRIERGKTSTNKLYPKCCMPYIVCATNI